MDVIIICDFLSVIAYLLFIASWRKISNSIKDKNDENITPKRFTLEVHGITEKFCCDKSTDIKEAFSYDNNDI